MASGSGDPRGAGAMDQGDDQITQGGHNLGGMTGAQAGTVFAKADIAHIVRTFFNTPMPAVQGEQALRTSLGGREGGDEIDDLSGGLAGFRDAAGELGHLGDIRPAGGEIGSHLGTDLDRAHFEASASTVNRLRSHIVCLRIGKIGRQVGGEGGLIAFDRQDGLGLLRMDDAHEVGLRVQGIGSTDSMLDRQGGQHGLRHRDLVGFFVHAHLEDTFPGCDGSRRPADGERSARQIGLPARSCHPVRAARRPGLPWWLVPSFPTRAQGRRHRVAATASDTASRLPVRKSRGPNTRRSTGR